MQLVRSILTAATAVLTLAAAARAEEAKTAPHPEFVYVTHHLYGQAYVSALRANPATGQLTPVPGSPFESSAGAAWDVEVDRRNRLAFVTGEDTAALEVWSIASSGALTRLSSTEIGYNPMAIARHPTRPFLYTADILSRLEARRYDEATGAVSVIEGSPFAAPHFPSGIVVDPTGRFLYVAQLFTASNTVDGSVWAYRIDQATGALSPIGRPLPTGLRTLDLAIDPAGRHLYAVNGDTADIAAFAIDAASGLLTPLPGAPFASVADVALTFAMAHDGRFLYVVSRSAHAVLTYARDTATGSLAPVGAPLDLPEAPEHVALDCTGRFLHVSHGDPVNAVSVVRLDPATGAPALASGAALGPSASYGVATTSFGCPPQQVSPH